MTFYLQWYSQPAAVVAKRSTNLLNTWMFNFEGKFKTTTTTKKKKKNRQQTKQKCSGIRFVNFLTPTKLKQFSNL